GLRPAGAATGRAEEPEPERRTFRPAAPAPHRGDHCNERGDDPRAVRGTHRRASTADARTGRRGIRRAQPAEGRRMERTGPPGAEAPDGAAPQDASARRQWLHQGPVMTPVVSELADRAEITSLVSRYFGAIDDKRLDRATVEAAFTASGRL